MSTCWEDHSQSRQIIAHSSGWTEWKKITLDWADGVYSYNHTSIRWSIDQATRMEMLMHFLGELFADKQVCRRRRERKWTLLTSYSPWSYYTSLTFGGMHPWCGPWLVYNKRSSKKTMSSLSSSFGPKSIIRPLRRGPLPLSLYSYIYSGQNDWHFVPLLLLL